MKPEVMLPLNGVPRVFQPPLEKSLYIFLTFYSAKSIARRLRMRYICDLGLDALTKNFYNIECSMKKQKMAKFYLNFRLILRVCSKTLIIHFYMLTNQIIGFTMA